MPAASATSDFNISVTGETTGEKWFGNFTVKTRLSHRDNLNLDRIRRELVGPNPETISSRTKQTSEAFAHLGVRVVKAPSWWTDNGNGLDLADDNVIAEVFNKAIEVEAAALESLKKAGEEAKAALTKMDAEAK